MILTVLLFAAQVFSQVPTGNWRGNGIYDAWGVGRFDSQVTMEISIQDSRLNVKDCWKFTRNDKVWNLCYDHSFDIIGTELFVEETKVGNVRDQELEIIYKREEGQIHALLQWDANNILRGFHNAVAKSGRYTNKSSERLEPVSPMLH